MQSLGSCFTVADDLEPNNYQEAVSCEDSAKWVEAMGEEHAALVSNDTWDLVEKQDGMNVLKCKWVYKLKRNAEGVVVRYKARLVVCGYAMQHGIDYLETFSPVAKIQTIRLLFGLAAQFNCHMEQFDIPNAYVKASVDEGIYLSQPEAFIDEHWPERVLKLKKALYDLKQAGRNWNQHFKEFLLSLGLVQCRCDPCMYYMVVEEGTTFVIMIVYVDDVLALSPSAQAVELFLEAVDREFNIARMGLPKWFLGIRVSKDGISTFTLISREPLWTCLKSLVWMTSAQTRYQCLLRLS